MTQTRSGPGGSVRRSRTGGSSVDAGSPVDGVHSVGANGVGADTAGSDGVAAEGTAGRGATAAHDPGAEPKVQASPDGPVGDGPARPTGIGEWMVRAGCVALLLVFGWLVYGYVFSNGVCCADDSYISMAAKNLAAGNGYAISYSIQGSSDLSPFDPAITTGPSLVLPAAGVIAIVGNTAWAPGFAAATVSLLLLVTLGLVVRPVVGTTRALVLVAFFVFLLYCATAGSTFAHSGIVFVAFAQWYALLGEIPAALFTVVGLVVIAKDPQSRRGAFLGGLLLGLALTSKTLAVVVAVPAFGYLLARVVMGRGQRKDRWWLLLLAGGGYLLPTALFELWKLGYLGFAGYRASLREWWSFFFKSGNGSAASKSVKLSAYWLYYGFPFVLLLGVIALVAVLLLVGRRPAPAVLRFFWLTAAGAVLTFPYFVFYAPNLPRYALIGTVLGLCAVACVVLSRANKALVLGLAVVCAVPLLAPWQRMSSPFSYVATEGYRPNDRVTNLEIAAGWLDEHKTDQRYLGGWWATVDDLEYMMSTSQNFDIYSAVPVDQLSGRILVRNRIWSDFATSAEFEALADRCSIVLLDAAPYLITGCP